MKDLQWVSQISKINRCSELNIHCTWFKYSSFHYHCSMRTKTSLVLHPLLSRRFTTVNETSISGFSVRNGLGCRWEGQISSTIKLSLSLGPQLCQGRCVPANSDPRPQLPSRFEYVEHFTVVTCIWTITSFLRNRFSLWSPKYSRLHLLDILFWFGIPLAAHHDGLLPEMSWFLWRLLLRCFYCHHYRCFHLWKTMNQVQVQ